MLLLAAPHIPAELFSFCIAAIPGPLAGAAFCCTPAFELALFQMDPKASPPVLAGAAAFAVGLPSVAIVVLEPYDCCGVVVVDGVLAEKALVDVVDAALISALTDVK